MGAREGNAYASSLLKQSAFESKVVLCSVFIFFFSRKFLFIYQFLNTGFLKMLIGSHLFTDSFSLFTIRFAVKIILIRFQGFSNTSLHPRPLSRESERYIQQLITTCMFHGHFKYISKIYLITSFGSAYTFFCFPFSFSSPSTYSLAYTSN